MSICKDCIHYEICDEYVSPNESFPEVDGCKCFKSSAEVVEVVRCKDCVSSRPLNRNDRFEARYSAGCVYCMRTDEGVAYDDYCSCGKRREK